MKIFITVLTSIMFYAGASIAADPTVPVVLKDQQTVIQVNGVVCSFCAYGAEKNLSKLNFLDKSFYDGDGVMVDIHTHRITLALNRSKAVDYPAINDALVKGGYDPVLYYARVQGKIDKVAGKYILTSQGNGQQYELVGPNLAALAESSDIVVEGEITVKSLVNISDEQPAILIVNQ